MSRQLPAITPQPHGRIVVAGEPHVFHCNYYNYWLQKSLLLVPNLKMEEVMADAAAAVAYSSISAACEELGKKSPEERLSVAADLFSQFGFGTIDWSGANAEGGTVHFPTSHYGQTFRVAIEGDDFARTQNIFDQGFAAGALACAFDLPLGSLVASIESCHSMGASKGTVTLSRRTPPEDFPVSCREGRGSGATPPGPNTDCNIDEGAILEALSGLDFSGNEEGMMPRFGVMLTLHWANYYDRISFALINRMMDGGQIDLAETLLVDAGHRCAFSTFGGIMTSAEWDAVVKPQCKTREDWVHGMVAVVNALGWGVWRVAELTEDRLVIRVWDDYESRGYLGAYGESKRPICYLHQGGVAGLMNLVYTGDIRTNPTRDADYYASIFNDPRSFTARQTKCIAQGDEYTEIVAER